MTIGVRRAGPGDHAAWARMLHALHGGQSAAAFEAELAWLVELPEPYVGFIAETAAGHAVGMIDARVRNYAEGAPRLRAAYVEDLWVEPAYRRAGVAALLLAAVEDWARDQGLDWVGSDAMADNAGSHAWHEAAGFRQIERIVVFGKPLG